MRKYLFFVNAEYCYAILRPLQKVIHARGDQAAWFVFDCSSDPLKENELQLATVDEVMHYRPDAVFSPGDWVPYFFPGAKIQVFHGIARNKRGAATENDSDHYRIRGLFDLYCTHAENDTLRFQQLANELGTFRVVKTGWPKLDALLRRRVDDHTGHCGEIPTVFFASTFSPSITAAPELATTLERLSSSGRWRFIVTLHPKMPEKIVARYQSIRNPFFEYVPAGVDLVSAMDRTDVMLCDTSSIMYEFMFLDKPVVTFRTRNPGPWLIDVKNIGSIESALERALTRPEELMNAARSMCTELHEFRDGMSSERVLDAAEELCDIHLKTLKSKPINLVRKIKSRVRLGYWKL